MTDTTAIAPITGSVGEGHAADAHHGPVDKYYVRIAVALAVITAAEVAWSYLPIWDGASGFKSFIEVGVLLTMMAVKFVVVASNFMHLKFDGKVLTRVFYASLVLAVGVYLAVLATFELFSSTTGYG